MKDAAREQASGIPDALEIVTFTIGGHRFATEARQVRAARPLEEDDTACLPIEALLGEPVPSRRGKARQSLVFRHQTADKALEVAAPVQMKCLEIASIHPLPGLIAARNRLPGLRAIALEPDGLRLLIDISSLFSQ